MVNNQFYNPYHFVPVKHTDRIDDISKTDFLTLPGHITHDRYVQDTYSGRIVCKLIFEDPVVLGSERKEIPGKFCKVEPFQLEGKPAIPASTLRGLISSVAEAASNSALRVLKDEKYHVRQSQRPYGKIPVENSYAYFKNISPELLPFNGERKKITIAEQIFGFTQQEKQNEDTALALAGRLRFSFGILDSEIKEPYYDSEVPLKILNEPKPPYPAFYFKPDNKDIPNLLNNRTELKSTNCSPQGRKFYLHRQESDMEPWRSTYQDPKANKNLKSYVQPIKKTSVFYFHIDFNNLTQRELGLLCYALRPSEQFYHKLGMGKPLGLGKVNIAPVGIFYIDRKRRYSIDTLDRLTRYHAVCIVEGSESGKLPDTYVLEKASINTGINAFPEFDNLRKVFADTMDPDIKKAMELIGNPENIKHPVHYPQLFDETVLEKETYKWFGKNKQQNYQPLKPIDKNTNEIDPLKRNLVIQEDNNEN